MQTSGSRRVDRAAGGNSPPLFAFGDRCSPLYLAVIFLAVALVLVLLGEPLSYGAAASIGGAIGLNIRVLWAVRKESGAASD